MEINIFHIDEFGNWNIGMMETKDLGTNKNLLSLSWKLYLSGMNCPPLEVSFYMRDTAN